MVAVALWSWTRTHGRWVMSSSPSVSEDLPREKLMPIEPIESESPPVDAEVCKGESAQVSSSSLDYGSKLRDLLLLVTVRM
ncbi:hypothetical protein TNCV_1512791 [Trichonephila clavipes]|nr:hypothetical protein TNCV_1512791 [Trichonephila clavipes]